MTETEEAPAEQKQGEKSGEDAPSAKKMMAENDLKDGDVTGTGKDGRVMKLAGSRRSA